MLCSITHGSLTLRSKGISVILINLAAETITLLSVLELWINLFEEAAQQEDVKFIES